MPQSKSQDIDIDIFNTSLPMEAENLSSANEKITVDQPPTTQEKRASFLLKLKPIYFCAMVLGLALLWIAEPYIFSSQKEFQNMPYALTPPHVATMEKNPALSESEKVISTAQNNFPDTNPIAPESLPDAVAQVEKNLVSELQEQVDTLQKKIAQMDAKPAQCATTASIRKKKLASHPLKTKTQEPAQIASDYVTKEIEHVDFRLNTIYRDQAWIKNNKEDRIHLVQAGDVIGDMRVLHIEPETRRVVTTLGDIR